MVLLSDQQAEIKALVYDRRRSYAEVASWLKISVGTVNCQVYRLRKKYRLAGLSLPDNRQHFVACRN
jgi:DNA-directed RNA polymerase specialized sigma24 family protein